MNRACFGAAPQSQPNAKSPPQPRGLGVGVGQWRTRTSNLGIKKSPDICQVSQRPGTPMLSSLERGRFSTVREWGFVLACLRTWLSQALRLGHEATRLRGGLEDAPYGLLAA